MRPTRHVACLLLLVLAACEGAPPPGEDLAMGDGLRGTRDRPDDGVLEQALEVCADGATVRGIDVSKWQGDINWAAVAGDGVKYAFIRVSDGLRYHDEKFARNWAGARSNRVLRGAYQFFRPGQDPEDQADLLIARIREHGEMDLPPVIDVEATDGQNAQTIVDRVGRWIRRVEAELGVRPIIYSGKYFWQDNVGNSRAFRDYLLWHPQYTNARCPNIADAWADWAFWQFTSSGRVAGISGNVDVNRFNGTEEALGRLRVGVEWAGQPLGQTFPLAAQPPIELCVGETMEGTIRVRNTGSNAWDANVRLAPTPRDRASALHDPSWISDTRVTAAEANTAPGAEARFTFTIRGNRPGLVNQTFGLVAEGVSWFADAGGPRDDYLELKAEVRDCDRPPAGALEEASCEAVTGWAQDPDAPAEALEVRLDFDDGAETLTLTANARRPDPCGDACDHGFSAPWPEALRDGAAHAVRAFVGDVALEGSPKSVRCEPAAVPDAGGEVDAAIDADAAAIEVDAAVPDAGEEPLEPDAAPDESDGGLILPPGALATREAAYEGGCAAAPGAPIFTLFALAGLAARRRRR